MADQHVFEGAQVRCTAKLPESLAGKTVKFVFTDAITDEKIGEAPAAVQSGTFSGVTAATVWVAKACKAGEDSYRAHYHLEVPGRSVQSNFPDDIYVYRKKFVIEAKREPDRGGGAYEDALLTITQDEPPEGWRGRKVKTTNTERRTLKSGKIEYELPYPAAVNFEWKAPYELLDGTWTKDKGEAREATLKHVPLKAKITFPIADDESDDGFAYQWVNLPTDPAEPSHGSKLKIVVEPTNPAGAKSTDEIFLKVEFDAENSDRTPAAGGYGKGRSHTFRKVLGPTKKAVIELELGKAGGDKVKLSAGSTAACADDKITVQNWRKVKYELRAPDFMTTRAKFKLEKGVASFDGSEAWDFPEATRKHCKERLAKAFVRLELWKSHVFPKASAWAGSVYDGAFIGQSAGTDVVALAFAHQSGGIPRGAVPDFTAADNVTLKMTLADRAASAKRDPNTGAYVPPTVFAEVVTKGEFTVPTAGYVYRIHMGTGADSIPAYGAVAFPTDALIWTPNPDDVPQEGEAGYDEFIAAYPDHPGLEAPDRKKRVTGGLPRGVITHVTETELKVKLTGLAAALAGALSATKCPLVVTFKYNIAYCVNGSALGNQQLMVVARPPKAIATTICHELGHSMGLTVKQAGTFKTLAPHGLAFPPEVHVGDVYDGKGHQGTHCAFGISEKKKRESAASYQGLGGKCIMFGEGGDEAEPKRKDFCETCIKYIRARNLADIATRFDGRADADC